MRGGWERTLQPLRTAISADVVAAAARSAWSPRRPPPARAPAQAPPVPNPAGGGGQRVSCVTQNVRSDVFSARTVSFFFMQGGGHSAPQVRCCR